MLKSLGGVIAALCLSAAVASAAEPPSPVTDLGPGQVGVYYPPPHKGGPVVLILGGSEGGFAASGSLAKALAEAGFGAMALAYFKAPGLPATLENIPLEGFTRAADWLQARPEVGRRRLGLVGVSKGGEAALIVAARDPRFCAVIAAVPSSVAWVGVNPTNIAASKASWTWSGQPLAYASYDFSNGAGGIRAIYAGGLAKAPADAVIPVERIRGPVLLISGRDDKLWPSTPMADQVMARLDAAKFRYAHTHLAYDGAGHAAFGKPWPADVVPNPAVFAQAGGTAEGTLAARADNWPQALVFLDSNLNGKGCR